MSRRRAILSYEYPCNDVQNYYYSTLNSKDITLNLEKTELGALIPSNKFDLIKWLNMPLPKEYEELIKKGLRKSEMKLIKSQCRRPHILENVIF